MNFPKLSYRLHLIACATFMGTYCPNAYAGHVQGILVPEIVISGKNKLLLNGTAVRAKWGFNVYVVALYLTRQNSDAGAIMGNRDPKRIHITMLHGISETRFVSTIDKNVNVNFSKEEKEKYATELIAFMACFHGGSSLERFSIINIDYIPDKGMQVTVDGVNQKLIPGDDFYHAIMRLWIGVPPQESLKTGLTGKD